MIDTEPLDLNVPLLIGFGITGQAVARALADHGHVPVIVDDRPNDDTRRVASELGIRLVESPDKAQLASEVRSATVVLPSPGVPDHHPIFELARHVGCPVASEFDLARGWDDRPLVAITGTNGKTTVTMMVTDALRRTGLAVEAVGNTEVPLVSAITDTTTDVFVVEASSFRLAHSQAFAPDVAVWLNFSPDHLDAHATLEAYTAAKASIWANAGSATISIVNAADSVVAAHQPKVGTIVSFGRSESDWRVEGDALVGPGFSMSTASIARRQPHDLANAAAAAATARAAGANDAAISSMLEHFTGLAHRVEFVLEHEGIRWFNDSKATVPHATLAAVGGFDSVVLIAGGRNKGLDLSELAQAVPPVRAVIATGDAGQEIADAFGDLVPIHPASSMPEAIDQAVAVAASGDVVLLSPACTSYDWYPNYKARGDDFRLLVQTRFAS